MLVNRERSQAETRMTAMLRAKMRDRQGAREVRVGDISPSGLLVSCEKPPAVGEVIDIEIAGHNIVGVVRWVKGRRCGVRSSERINVIAILIGKPPRQRAKSDKPDSVAAFVQDSGTRPLRRLLLPYGLLGATSFSTAYLLVNYVIL